MFEVSLNNFNYRIGDRLFADRGERWCLFIEQNKSARCHAIEPDPCEGRPCER